MTDRLMVGDPKQPRAQGRSLLESLQIAVGQQKRLLRQIFSIAAMSHPTNQGSVDRSLILHDDLLKGATIPANRPFDPG
jgi:hypothetical protein